MKKFLLLLVLFFSPLWVKASEVPFFSLNENTVKRLSHGWVDEVFILQPDHLPFSAELMEQLMEMLGETAHIPSGPAAGTSVEQCGEDW